MFSIIDTHEKAYILGFLLTDGNVYKNTIRFELQQRDYQILNDISNIFDRYNIKTHLKYHSKSLFTKSGELKHYSKLSINNKDLVRQLSLLEVKPCKSHTVQLPEINSDYFNSLLRGIIDGDGWIHYRRNGLELGLCSGSITFLEQVLKTINKNLNISIKTIYTKINKVNSICYYGNESLKILEYIYDNSDLNLNRKKQTYISFEKKISPRLWTDNQKRILFENYIPNSKGCIKKIMILTGKSYKAITKKVWEFKLNHIQT